MSRYQIAGLEIELAGLEHARSELESVFAEFANRADAYAASGDNPHLCRAGCSHCCRSGAFFAVTLAEAIGLTDAVHQLDATMRSTVVTRAERLLAVQRERFSEVTGDADAPGRRDETLFTSRVAHVNRTDHPTCPLLEADLCTVYSDRPFLCRAYGYPVDAFAVRTDDATVFRSLCHLYEGLSLTDYVRAGDLHARLAEISNRLSGDRNVGRFTSAEAILATLETRHASEPAASAHARPSTKRP